MYVGWFSRSLTVTHLIHLLCSYYYPSYGFLIHLCQINHQPCTIIFNVYFYSVFVLLNKYYNIWIYINNLIVFNTIWWCSTFFSWMKTQCCGLISNIVLYWLHFSHRQCRCRSKKSRTCWKDMTWLTLMIKHENTNM